MQGIGGRAKPYAIWGRWRPVAVSLAATVAGGLLLSPGAPASSLDFSPCTREGHEAFDCAKLRTPLKRSADARQQSPRRFLTLHVERLRRPDQPRTALLALAGGPGQGASALAPVFAQGLEPLLDDHQLVVIDQRGTGLSGALDCSEQTEGIKSPVRSSRRCAAALGPAARWYTTHDSVADIERLRRRLGAEGITIFGVSYGTFVAQQYARSHPDRVGGLVLDSVMGPGGWDPLVRPSFRAAPRVLRALCAGGACDGATRTPVADTRRVVEQARRSGLRGTVVRPDGERRRRRLTPGQVFSALFQSDTSVGLQALYPGALKAARRGDLAPAVRLVTLMRRLAGDLPPPSSLSVALNIATSCSDLRASWRPSDSAAARRGAARVLARSTSPDLLDPFDRGAALSSQIARSCYGWPWSPQPRATTRWPPPDVPALLLEGELDLRTPLESMRRVASRLPRSQSTLIGNRGHSVFLNPCAQRAIADWAAGRPVQRRCEEEREVPIQDVPPAALGQLEPLAVPGRPGRTLAAVLDAINDADVVAFTLATLAGEGEGFRAGGLRAGSLRARAGERKFSSYSFVPGVRMGGDLEKPDDDWVGTLRVFGSRAAAGELELHEDGRVTGKLGGTEIDHDRDASAARTLRALRELQRAKGPIPPVPLP